LLPVLEKNTQKYYTAGGWTKASTGYTFKIQINIQPNQIPEQGRNLKKFHHKTKFWYYDLLLLDILDRKTN
jgi:lycopene beta-cyclase